LAAKLAISTPPDVQTKVIMLLHDMCTRNVSSLGRLLHCRVRASAADPSGTTTMREMSGLQAVVTVLKEGRAKEISGATAAAILGELAPLSHEVVEEIVVAGTQPKLSEAELQALYKGDADFDAEAVAPCKRTVVRRTFVRATLVDMGCIDLMIAALFDVAAALAKWQDTRQSSSESATPEVRLPIHCPLATHSEVHGQRCNCNCLSYMPSQPDPEPHPELHPFP
jgi:hypothetical protein